MTYIKFLKSLLKFYLPSQFIKFCNQEFIVNSQKMLALPSDFMVKLERTSNYSKSTCPVGRVLWEELLTLSRFRSQLRADEWNFWVYIEEQIMILTLQVPAKMLMKMSSAKVVCCKHLLTLLTNVNVEANIVDPDQTAC